jgi:hypothetical protein
VTPRSASAMSARIATASAMRPMIVKREADANSERDNERDQQRTNAWHFDHRLRLKRGGGRTWMFCPRTLPVEQARAEGAVTFPEPAPTDGTSAQAVT